MYYNCTRETQKMLNPPFTKPPFVNSRARRSSLVLPIQARASAHAVRLARMWQLSKHGCIHMCIHNSNGVFIYIYIYRERERDRERER